MMEAYRGEGNMLVITKLLLDPEVFEKVEMAAHAGSRGRDMRAEAGAYAGCQRQLIPLKQLGTIDGGACAIAAAAARSGKDKSK
jgi:hypothetical protein